MAIKKLILDLDMGVDDAMALAYVIASPEVELVGVTTCFGNVRVEQSAHNCLAVLDLLGRPEVPVYLGADRPMKATEPYTPPASTALIHGKNGIGGASVPASPYEPVGATSADGNAAVDYLIDAARTYGPDLVYVATGPLTNLALALERDAAAMMYIGRVVVMGGAHRRWCGRDTHPASQHAGYSRAHPRALDQSPRQPPADHAARSRPGRARSSRTSQCSARPCSQMRSQP